jgi:hypothetical protein
MVNDRQKGCCVGRALLHQGGVLFTIRKQSLSAQTIEGLAFASEWAS